jgi:hypothetical protein
VTSGLLSPGGRSTDSPRIRSGTTRRKRSADSPRCSPGLERDRSFPFVRFQPSRPVLGR